LPKGRGTATAVEGYKNFEFKISNFEFSKPPAVEGYKNFEFKISNFEFSKPPAVEGYKNVK